MLDSGDDLDYLVDYLGGAPKRRRFRRAALSIVCVVAFILIGDADADTDTGNLWAIPPGALLFTAVIVSPCRRGGPGNTLDEQAMRVLRLHWRLLPVPVRTAVREPRAARIFFQPAPGVTPKTMR